MREPDPYLPPQATATTAAQRSQTFASLGGWTIPLAGGLSLFTAYGAAMTWGRLWWVLNAPDAGAFHGNLPWDVILSVVYGSATLGYGTTLVLLLQRARLFRPAYVASCLAAVLMLFLIGSQPHSLDALLSPTDESLYISGIAIGWSAFWIPWLHVSRRAKAAFAD